MNLELYQKHAHEFIENISEILVLVEYGQEVQKNKTQLQKDYEAFEKDIKEKQQKLLEDVQASEVRVAELRKDLLALQDAINASVQERKIVEDGILKRKKEIDTEMAGYRRQMEIALDEFRRSTDSKKAKLQGEVDELRVKLEEFKQKILA